MLQLAILFLVMAIVAALFSFGLIASAFVGLAQILFVVFLVLFGIFLLFGAGWSRSISEP